MTKLFVFKSNNKKSIWIGIEKMTAKTGNFKPFNVFVNMLENAINQVKYWEKYFVFEISFQIEK